MAKIDITREKAFEVLGIEPGTKLTIELIDKHFRQQAILHHPDKHPNSTTAVQEMQDVNAAKDLLCRELNIELDVRNATPDPNVVQVQAVWNTTPDSNGVPVWTTTKPIGPNSTQTEVFLAEVDRLRVVGNGDPLWNYFSQMGLLPRVQMAGSPLQMGGRAYLHPDAISKVLRQPPDAAGVRQFVVQCRAEIPKNSNEVMKGSGMMRVMITPNGVLVDGNPVMLSPEMGQQAPVFVFPGRR